MHKHLRKGFVLAGIASFAILATQLAHPLRMAQVESPPSPEVEVITMAATPPAPIISDVTESSFKLVIDSNGNPVGTEYAVFESGKNKWIDPYTKTISTNSAAWGPDNTAWGSGTGIVISGLSVSTTYTLAVKARNSLGEETPLGPATVVMTNAVVPSAPPPETPPPTTPPPEPPPPETPPVTSYLPPQPEAPPETPPAETSTSTNIGAGGGTASLVAAPVITGIRLLTVHQNADDPTLFDPTFEIRGTADISITIVTFALYSDPIIAAFPITGSPWVIEWTPRGVPPGPHSISVVGAAPGGEQSATSLALNIDLSKTSVTSSVLYLPQCSDGIDNDNDGLTDYPNDSDCASPDGTSELGSSNVGAREQIIVPVITKLESTPVGKAIRTVIDNPQVEIVTRDAVAPAVTGAMVVTTAVATGPSFLLYLQYLLTVPLGLLTRRRRERWGVVYHSLTKQPIDLATVRLFDAISGRIVQTRVTDQNGRFIFLVHPGNYLLSAEKTSFDFPSDVLRGAQNDGRYAALYHGDRINIADKGVSIIAPSIPLDPLETKAPLARELRHRRRTLRVSAILPAIGLASGAVTFTIAPSGTLLTLLIINVLAFLFVRRLASRPRRAKYGAVIDADSKQPVKNAVVRLFDASYHKLIESQLTDSRGRYAFLVGPNVYEVTVEAPNYERGPKKIVDSRGKETALVDEKFLLKKVAPVV